MTIDEPGNQAILRRLAGIQKALVGLHEAGNGREVSNSTRGTDREKFIDIFLSQILPPNFRFGSGQITDLAGKVSGQVDVVVEYPFLPSIPILEKSSRLYLAEGVVAVIEVKSNLKNQWHQVKKTSEQLKVLRRSFGSSNINIPHIPLFAVGYKGWSQMETLKSKLEENVVDGILVIGDGTKKNEGLFIWNPSFLLPMLDAAGLTESAKGSWALWAFIICLNRLAILIQNNYFDPALYAMTDLVLFHRIYLKKVFSFQDKIDVFEVTDQDRLDHLKVKEIVKRLEYENLLTINKENENDEKLEISITSTGALLGSKLKDMLGWHL